MQNGWGKHFPPVTLQLPKNVQKYYVFVKCVIWKNLFKIIEFGNSDTTAT